MSGDPKALTIDPRFAGPPGSANGGYVAGRLASLLPASGGARARPDRQPAQVTLRQPPPLGARIDAAVSSGVATLTFGGIVLAEARPAQLTERPVDPVSFERATEVMSTYAGWERHPFPGCFACGTDRPPPDGLGLRPGRVTDRPDTVATAWIPDASIADDAGTVPVEMIWAALDCPGGWSAELAGRPMVLGRMTAAVDAQPRAGDSCVVVGRRLGTEGRKTFTASAAYDPDGRVLARAEATWIAVDPARLHVG